MNQTFLSEQSYYIRRLKAVRAPSRERRRSAPMLAGLTCGVSLLVLSSGVCHAQPTDAPTKSAPTDNASPPAVEAVVVTARFRSENLQEVPDTVQLFSEKLIRNTGIKSVKDLATLVPNFSFVSSQDAGLVLINVRGISQVRNGQPPVAVVVDGVQLSSPDQIRQPLFDIQGVEVLKGPQGALYGRNAIGGAIIVQTKQPGEEFENIVQIGYAEGQDRSAQFISSGPIIHDKLYYRISGDWRQFDGLIPDVTIHRNVDFATDYNFRGRLIYKPTDDLTIDLRGSYGQLHLGGAYIPLPDGHPNDTTIPVQAGIPTDSTRRLADASLKIDERTALGTISSVTAWSETDVHLYEELGHGVPHPALSAKQLREASSWSEDLRLTSPSDQRLRYTFGLYGLRNTPDILTNAYLLNASLKPVFTIPIAKTDDTETAYAIYGQVNYDILKQLELTLALRYDRQEVKQIDRLHASAVTNVAFGSLQPKVSLSYKFRPGSEVYATYAEGFRSGGLNAPSALFPLVYKAEGTKNIELGVKTSLFENRLVLDAAGYHTDYKNQAVFTLVGAVQGITSIPSTELYGVDLAATWHALPGFDLTGGFGWNHSRINDFNGTPLYVGNKSPLNYEYSYNLGAQYTKHFDVLALTGRIDYSHKEGLYWQVDNQDKQSPVDLVNLRLIADISNWELSLYATNVLNEKYTEEFCSKEFCGGVTDLRWPAMPRQVGAALRYTF
jgi:iron complex outermembrane receptor protein